MGLSTNLISYYKFDENAGTIIHDSVGTNNGTYIGAGTMWGTGIINSAGNFVQNNSDHIDIPGFNNIINYSAISVQAWYELQTFTNNPRFLANSHTDSDNKGFQLYIGNSGSQLLFQVGNGTTNTNSQFNGSGMLNNWIHLIGVYDGTNVFLYVNGTVQPSSGLTGNIGLSANDLWVSGNPAYSGDYMQGQIDEVGIWNRALTQAEVTALYNNGVGNQYPFGYGTVTGKFMFSGSLSLTGNL